MHLTSLAFFALVAAIPVLKGSANTSGVVSIPIEKRKGNSRAVSRSASRLHPRDGATAATTLQDDVTIYLATLYAGTPAQPQTVQVDSGSSDLWFFGSDMSVSQKYIPDDSSTSKYVNSGFFIEYADGSGETGDFYTDNIYWDGNDVTVQFGVAHPPSIVEGSFGVLGVGYSAGESGVSSSSNEYTNYLAALQNAGIIEYQSVSIALESFGSTAGSILFGGVDHSKYQGQLWSIPYYDFTQSLIRLGMPGLADYEFEAVIDSGTSFTYLPSDITDQLASRYNMTFNSTAGLYTSYGKPALQGVDVTFDFYGANITIPESELLLEVQSGLWGLTFAPNSLTGTNLLGDSTLRSTYVVYNFAAPCVTVAQAKGGDTGSPQVEPLKYGGVPGAVGAPNVDCNLWPWVC